MQDGHLERADSIFDFRYNRMELNALFVKAGRKTAPQEDGRSRKGAAQILLRHLPKRIDFCAYVCYNVDVQAFLVLQRTAERGADSMNYTGTVVLVTGAAGRIAAARR